MAGNYTVDVSVALKAQQASIKNIRKQIETEFGEVDFNSSVGKKLSKLFDQFDNRISNMDSILGKGVLNASDLSKLGALFDSMNLIVGQMRSAAGKAPLMDLGIDPNEVPEIVAAMKELQKVQAKISAEENQSSKEALKAMNKQKTLEKMKELEGSKSSEDKSLRENERIIEAEYQQRKAAQEKLQQELDSLEAKRKSKLQEQAIEEQKARDTREAAQAKQLEAREKKLVEKNAIKKIKTEQGKTFKNQQQNINDFINQVYSDGAIAAEAHLKSSGLAGSLVRALFSDDEMDALAGQSAEKFRQAFQAKLFENGGKSVNQQNLDTVINTAQEWGRNNPETAAQAQRTANVLQQQVSQHELNSKNAGIEANAIQTEIEGKTQELNNLSVEVAKFSAVVNELSNAASELRASVDSKYKDELNNAQKGLQGAHQNAKMKMIPSTEPGNPAFQRGGVDSGLNSINMAQEADSFTARMKQGIKQWMGAREVIGYIKQGIRSAYQDIQGLDKAMTNIAVVTDMSTSDLWGKIDQYMGMAQKYGVTTQGVYEVSQLFFQQGLGEADTMAATVETLKMARIAGMDYKDAADGMTVAIRGFNMEMSEAAHVTDVYSKVAAITASDTQELVSAMSKTASSAASVGSSFENTTAMLAVMVEATRESPQNIGSAMKSIISRYGEMTKGLSEDSEGEEIDYNRVDTALKSIGISLKDAQGQFREFDDVIFELAGKWDTLDSVTQRYVATIFAGNRQQSRFLALVSNADRLQEVSDAAANSEDAGLLQYSKTMDSLETKINNIKTSFQQFYMDIFNGPLIGKGLDFINNMIKGFNKLGKLTSVMNIASIILGVKALVNLFVQPFGQIGNIISRSIDQGIRNGFANARAYGEAGGGQMRDGVQQGMSRGGGVRRFFENHIGEFASLAQMAGGALSAWGSRVASSGTADNAGEMLQRGHNLSTTGNALSGAGTGASVGMAFGPWGALIGAVLGGITALVVSWFNRPDELDKAIAEQEKAEEEAQEKQVTRAEAVQRETDLEATIEKLKELKKHQYDSAEAQQAFVDANNEAFEKFPELAATFDSAGNAIMDVTTAEQALALARQTSAQATYEAMVAEIKKVEKQAETNKLEQKEHLDNATTVLKDKNLMAGSYITDAVADEMRRHSTSDYQDMVNLELGRMGMEEYISEAGQSARQRVLDEGGNQLAAWYAEQNAESNAQQEFIQQHEQEAYATVAESFKSEAIQVATAPYLQGASLEDQQFLLDYYGSRYVDEEDANLARSQGRTDVAQNSFSTLTENGEKTFQNISGVASTFITKAITSLDQSDQETANFLKTLGDTASDTDAMGMILQNFQSLAWDEGVDPTLFMSKFFGYDYSTREGRDAFDKLIGDYQNLLFEEQRLGQAGIATRKTLASYNTNTYIDNDTDRAKSVDSITGARGYLQQIASNYVDNNVSQDASYFTADKIQREIADEAAQFENFEELSRALGVSDKVSALNQSAISGNITRENWMSQMEELNVVNPETLAFLNDFAETYLFKDSEQLKLNAVKALQQSSIAWSTNITRTDLDGLGTDNILNEIADNYVSSITQFNNYLEDSVESGNMSQRTANQMAREYLSVWEASTTLPAEQIAEAQRLISEADLTTTLGKEDLKANLEDAGIYDDALVAEIDGVYPYAENLVTQYGQLEDKLINGLESMSDALSGASEGMNMSEAQKVANKVGKDLLDLFNFQDGQYVAKDANALREIQEAYATEEKAALDESYQNQMRILQQEGTTEDTWEYDEDGHLAPVRSGSFIAPSEEYMHLVEQYGEAADAWYKDLEQNGQLELEGLTGGESQSEIIQAYLTDLKEDTDKAIDEQTRWQIEQAQQALDITNRTFELEGGVNGRNKRGAFDLLASNGLTGYTAEQIAQLETYLGVGADGLRASETGIGTGEYRISRRALEGLNLPTWVQDGINAQIEEQVQSAKSGLEDVMSSVASGEELTETQLKQLLGEEFEGIPDTIAQAYQGAMQTAMETGNFGHLENILKTVYASKGSEEADKLAKESIARFKDQIEESRKEIIDLSISALEGDISAEDALKLGAQGIDVDGLINRTQEAINTLVQSIVDNTDISFGDKKSKLESVYNAGLESILGYETSIADSLTNREGMSRSDASSMMAELTALGVKTKGRFEESADGTKFYLNNVTDIMNDLTRTIQDESTNPQQRAAAESLLKQVRYAQEWQPYELADSLGSTIEEMANATEISTIEMRDFYKELTGRDISAEDARHLATELNELDPVARIEQLVAIARQSGINVEGMEERLAETAANVLDTIIEAISNGMSSIGEGLSGTLSFASLNELMQKYNLQIQDSFGTASGATLGEQDRRSLIAAMYKEAKASGLQVDFGDQLWETFRDSDNNPFVGYNAIDEELSQARSRARELQSDYEAALRHQRATDIWSQEARERAETYATPDVLSEAAQAEAMAEQADAMAESTARAAEEARAYAEALEQARAAAMFDENAYEFTFMEQDATNGLTKNADNFINQIETVKTAFQSFKNEESIGYQDFYNMMDFIKNTGQWQGFTESFSQELQTAGIEYEDFVNSVVAHTDEWGKVDIGGVAAEMGISVDAAMTAMSDSMKGGLIEVAKQQVDYLTGLENMLKAMEALESIGDIGLGLEISVGGQVKTAEQWINSWGSLNEEQRVEFIAQLKVKTQDNIFDNNGITQDMRGAFDEIFGVGFSDTLNSQIFNENGEIISTEIAGQYMQLAASVSKASLDQSGELAQGMAHTMSNVQGIYMDSLGYALGQDGLWRDAQGQVAQLTAVQNMELLKLLNDAAKNATPMDIAGFSESYLQALNAGDTQVNISEGRTIELNWNGTTTITDADGNPLTPEAVRALDAEAIAQMEAELNQNRADADHYYDLIVDAQGRLTYNIIPVGDVNAVLENTPDMLTVGGEEIDVIVNANTQSITFADSHGRTLTGDALQDAVDAYTSQMNLSDRGLELNMDENGIITLVPTVTPAPSNTEILAQIASDIQAIKDSLLQGFDITLNGDQATSALGAIQSAYDELRAHFVANPLIARMIQVGGISLPSIPTNFPTTQTPSGVGPFAGTMNGLAFADGSLGRLHSGAVLANKALVGELGPELAVYDGQYHMLGANGAEFVDLPSDAIIFNHLQTQGILRGQMNIRGTAMADGNVSGPAYAGGIGAALSAVSRAKSVWQGLLSSLTAADLLDGGGGGGGGGGGESLKAHIADLQEWYNLSRQIAKIESEINTLISKRNNLTDGHEYLRNLRETQRLLDDQVNTQQDLLRFQELQLQRQADHINNNKIWSQFLRVDENGLLQYIEGNETNGGKGALEVLSKMNEMSGEEQLAYVQSLGWSYTTTDGEELEEAQLVAKFYEELQKQIDDYDALADTVNEAESALEDLEGQINEIEKEIRDNEIDLSQEIYDIIVDAWKENIENLKEQNDLIKEANEAYAQGIEKAISAERELYEQNQSIQEREQMQRQLALMRRSGGSASEIANLEAQLDEKLKEEYFANQEKALEDIREANERQVELMEQQVKIQEEQLKYQEENGVIWSKVYEVMQGTDAEILQFMQGNSTEFFQKSYLQQEDMLTEWAKKIGIYTEERQRENYMAEAATTFGNVWNNETGRGLQGAYNRAGAGQQQKWQREYNDTYTSKMLEGKTQEEALELAQTEFYEHIRNWLAEEEDRKNKNNQDSKNTDSESGNEESDSVTLYRAYGYNGNDKIWSDWNESLSNAKKQLTNQGITYMGHTTKLKFAKGGIIDFTGPAWVDGSKSKPERILSAEQNRILEEGLAMNAGRSDRLRDLLTEFASNIGSSVRDAVSSITKNTNTSAITIAPGAIQLNIEQLNDSYDVNELFNDVADRLYSIASRASGRGVSRR